MADLRQNVRRPERDPATAIITLRLTDFIAMDLLRELAEVRSPAVAALKQELRIGLADTGRRRS